MLFFHLGPRMTFTYSQLLQPFVNCCVCVFFPPVVLFLKHSLAFYVLLWMKSLLALQCLTSYDRSTRKLWVYLSWNQSPFWPLPPFKLVLTVSWSWVWKDLELTGLRKGGRERQFGRDKTVQRPMWFAGLPGTLETMFTRRVVFWSFFSWCPSPKTVFGNNNWGISPRGDRQSRLKPLLCYVTHSGLTSWPPWKQTTWRRVAARPPHFTGREFEEDGH